MIEVEEKTPHTPESNEKEITDAHWLEIYWLYYQTHADQRMRLLNYLIIIEMALFGSFFGTYQDWVVNRGNYWLSCYISVFIIFIGLVGFFLDLRTTNLIHSARVALRAFENRYLFDHPAEMRLFNRVKKETSTLNYSLLIRGSYLAMAFAGVMLFFFPFLIK